MYTELPACGRGRGRWDAAWREVAEELGLDITVGPPLTIDSAGDRSPIIAFIFDSGCSRRSSWARLLWNLITRQLVNVALAWRRREPERRRSHTRTHRDEPQAAL
jgi:hypothetical protein